MQLTEKLTYIGMVCSKISGKQHRHHVTCSKSHMCIGVVCSNIIGKQHWHHVACSKSVCALVWSAQHQSLPAGGLRGSIPGVMSAVLQKGLEQLKAVYTEAEQAGITSLGTLMSQQILTLQILPYDLRQCL